MTRLSRVAPALSFDYGAALRVPAAHDASGRAKLWAWLGEGGMASDRPGDVLVETSAGWTTARPGDWIILTTKGRFHVTAQVAD